MYGQVKPIVYWVPSSGRPIVVAGNGLYLAAKKLGWTHIAAVEFHGTEQQAIGYALTDNRTGELSRWHPTKLQVQLERIADAWTPPEPIKWAPPPPLLKLPAPTAPAETRQPPAPAPTAPPPASATSQSCARTLNEAAARARDEAPEPVAETRAKPGELWVLGRHRLLCGDSTTPETVRFLCASDQAALLHADPPYGAGKQIANDNLRGEKLDAFQEAWWRSCRPHLAPNASIYIWGQAPALWRLWYRRLADSESLAFRNEIVWDKGGSQPGQSSPEMRCYPPNSERCLFFMLGDQKLSTDGADHWPGWEPLRLALVGELEKTGWSLSDVGRITETSDMARHWFTTSQWSFIPEKHFEALKAAGTEFGAFQHDYQAVRALFEDLQARFRAEVAEPFYASRAFFDCTHGNFGEVWQFPRVLGADRPDHETPKPIELMERILRSSAPEGGIVLEPFIGSGTTLLAAEQTGRRCFGLELEPQHVDTTIRRWEKLTGMRAEKA